MNPLDVRWRDFLPQFVAVAVIVSAAVIFGHGCSTASPASHQVHNHQARHSGAQAALLGEEPHHG